MKAVITHAEFMRRCYRVQELSAAMLAVVRCPYVLGHIEDPKWAKLREEHAWLTAWFLAECPREADWQPPTPDPS